ncbi:MAG: hypothetical protein V1735_04475 [Nanoarchaeota archaeon]
MKAVIAAMILLILVSISFAQPAGIIVLYPSDRATMECVHLKANPTAEDALRASTFKTAWQGSGTFAFLTSLDGVENQDLEAWSFWVEEEHVFVPAQVGMGSHHLDPGEAFGLSYATFEPPEYVPSPAPPYRSDACALQITDLKAEADNDRKDVDESGGRIESVAPGATITLDIKVENSGEEDIEDITVSATVFDIDGDDIDDESDPFDLNDGRDKKVTLTLQVPMDADEDTFDGLILVESDEFRSTLPFELEIEKPRYNIRLEDLSVPESASCGGSVLLGYAVRNTGQNEQEVTFSVAGDAFAKESFLVDEDGRAERTLQVQLPQARTANMRISLFHHGGRIEEQRTVVMPDCAQQASAPIQENIIHPLVAAVPQAQFQPVASRPVQRSVMDISLLPVIGIVAVVLLCCVLVLLLLLRR